MKRKPSGSTPRAACLGGCAAALAAVLSVWPATVTVNIATEQRETVVVERTSVPGTYVAGDICPL
ncbi:hypothetical protein [Streptomyces sp. NPDC057877]|uniref:hypothetical protein n=1 Tax=Streptomyces sp. NPDC057877 TaxID=3346269 RepID=UPI0036CA5537